MLFCMYVYFNACLGLLRSPFRPVASSPSPLSPPPLARSLSLFQLKFFFVLLLLLFIINTIIIIMILPRIIYFAESDCLKLLLSSLFLRRGNCKTILRFDLSQTGKKIEKVEASPLISCYQLFFVSVHCKELKFTADIFPRIVHSVPVAYIPIGCIFLSIICLCSSTIGFIPF